MSNTHGIPSVHYEQQARWREAFLGYVLSGGMPATSLSLTLAPFATTGYVADVNELVYVEQPAPATGYTLTNGAGTYWVGLSRDVSTPISGWSRWAGTHYVLYFGIPASPLLAGVLPLARLTATASAITVVEPQYMNLALRTRGLALTTDPLMPPLGILSPVSNNGLYVQYGALIDPPTLVVDALNHRVGIGTPQPLVPLQVTGDAAITGQLGVGLAGPPSYTLHVGGQAVLTKLALNTTPPALDGQISTQGAVGIGVPANAGFALQVTASVPSRLDGAVGIGGITPAYTLHVNGNIGLPGGTGGIVNSTSRAVLKEAIIDLPDAVAVVRQLQPRQWTWRSETGLDATLPGPQTGFVLDEVQAVKPEWVTTDSQGTPGLRMQGLEAYLVSALQALLTQVEALAARVAVLERPAP